MDALNRKDKAIMGGPTTWDEKTLIELKILGEVLKVSPKGSLMAQLKVKLGYREQILEAQQLDDQVLKVRSKLKSGSETLFEWGMMELWCWGDPCMYLTTKSLNKSYYKRLISLSSLYIEVVLRCTRI
jgi:hypothetical protein